MNARPSDFTVGNEYYIRSAAGVDKYTKYTCVHIGNELVAFTFYCQGRERLYHAYYNQIKEDDFVLDQLARRA